MNEAFRPQPDTTDSSSAELARELLAINQTAREADHELKIGSHDAAREFVIAQREANGLLTPDGTLDRKEKFERSAYEVLTLGYYEENVQKGEGMPEPGYATDEEFREHYVHMTTEIIDKAIEGKHDIIYFMDKSARPTSWLVRELWPVFHPEVPMPEMKFVNIDANAVLNKPNPTVRPNEAEVRGYQASEEQVANIRKIYDKVESTSPHHPNQFHKGLIIDEVSVSGATQRLAVNIMHSAYPNIDFEAVAMMSPRKRTTGPRGHEMQVITELPVWYAKDFVEGRGIGEPDQSANPNLGTRYDGHDIQAEALRTDIELLAKDIVAGKQSVRASINEYAADASGKLDLGASKRFKLSRFNNFEIVNGKRVPGDGRRIVIPAPERSEQ